MPQARRSFPKLAWFFAIVAGVTIGALLAAHSEPARAQLTKSITERGTYYRLKVKLTYKADPQDFDIVVGCNVRQTFYAGGGSTYEAGLVPTVFGRRMSDGKTLVVRPPRACEGQTTSNQQVPVDLLPLVVVYDHADRLDFGTAYLSEDSYENSASVLRFSGATIERATPSEFDEFRRTQSNAVKRELYHSMLDSDRVLAQLRLTRVARTWAHVCEGYERFRIPEDLRGLIREQWPNDRPVYWQPDTFEAEGGMWRALLGSKLIRSDGADEPAHDPKSFGPISENEANYGFPTRAGGGLVNVAPTAQVTRYPPAYYPATNDYRLDRWPADRKDWPRYVDKYEKFADASIDLDDGRSKGLAYCYVTLFPDQTIASLVAGKRIVGRVGKHEIFSKRPPLTAPLLIFDRDEYVFRFFRFYLESTRGDV